MDSHAERTDLTTSTKNRRHMPKEAKKPAKKTTAAKKKPAAKKSAAAKKAAGTKKANAKKQNHPSPTGGPKLTAHDMHPLNANLGSLLDGLSKLDPNTHPRVYKLLEESIAIHLYALNETLKKLYPFEETQEVPYATGTITVPFDGSGTSPQLPPGTVFTGGGMVAPNDPIPLPQGAPVPIVG
jgi:hypothetical protein